VTTVQPHRRNLRDQLREHDSPQTNFEFSTTMWAQLPLTDTLIRERPRRLGSE
jgi:hypothetical protein